MRQFLGRRARFPSEVCPSCSDPGVGMVLEIDDAQDAVPRWICSKCCREEDVSQAATSEPVSRPSHAENIRKGLPAWLHVCERCVFLGTWHRDPKSPIDCYWCPNERYPNISSMLGRYGDLDQEYMSGNPPEAYCGGRAAHLPVADAWYLFALIRAHELGLYRLGPDVELDELRLARSKVLDRAARAASEAFLEGRKSVPLSAIVEIVGAFKPALKPERTR